MATLQKLRNKGPLLVGFVGLALFAFILSDAWQLTQSQGGDQTIGYLNGKEFTAQEFDEVRNICENSMRAASGNENISSQDTEATIIDAWKLYSDIQVANKQADLLGIRVTPQEIDYTLANMSLQELDYILRGMTAEKMEYLLANNRNALNRTLIPANFISVNQEAGIYELNADTIAHYRKLAQTQTASTPAERNLCDFYRLVELKLTVNAINSKQAAILSKGSIINHAVAKRNFELGNSVNEIEYVAYPYNSIADSLATVNDEEVNRFYEENKEYLFKNPTESRDIKVITVKLEPSNEDKEKLKAEMLEYAEMLKADSVNYNEVAMIAQSTCQFDEFLWTKKAVGQLDMQTGATTAKFPEDIQSRMEQANINELIGPYISYTDTTYNMFMNIEKQEVASEYMIRFAVVMSEVEDSVNIATENLLSALNSKTEFKEAAKDYMHFDSISFKTDEFAILLTQLYATTGLFITPELQNSIYNSDLGTYATAEINPNVKMIYQVISKDGTENAYKTVVIKRPIEVSNETRNNIYNDFSQFVAGCDSIEDFGKSDIYRAFSIPNVNSNNISLANMSGTRNALAWVLSDSVAEGQISHIMDINDDTFMAIAVEKVIPAGYQPLDRKINMYGYTYSDVIKNRLAYEKKQDIVLAELNGKNINEIKANGKIKTEILPLVEYNEPVTVLNAEEPVINTIAAKLNAGEISKPVKGNAAAYVVSVLSKKSKEGTLDVKAEQNYTNQVYDQIRFMQLANTNGQYYSQYLSSQPAEVIKHAIDLSTLNGALSEIYPVENKINKFF